MKQLRPGVGPRIAVLSLALLLMALVAAACAPAAPAGPGGGAATPEAVQPTAQPAPAANTPAPVKAGPIAPSAGGAKPGKASDVPMGVDADGNFYRGDPKAPVKLTEYSDFQ